MFWPNFKNKEKDKFLKLAALEGGLTLEEIKKEREEYVKNIGIEYRFGCYEEKQASACQLLAEYHEAIEQNFGEAFKQFRENCELRRWPRSCYKMGTYLLAGRECEPSFKKAIEPMRIACEGNEPKGCKRLAQIFWTAEPDREPESERAEQLMRRACNMDDFEACWILSTWHMGPTAKFAKRRGRSKSLEAKTGSLPKDMEKALEFGIRACEQGNIPQACMNVSRMYRIGDGIAKDVDKSNYFHRRSKELLEMIKKGWDPGFTG